VYSVFLTKGPITGRAAPWCRQSACGRPDGLEDMKRTAQKGPVTERAVEGPHPVVDRSHTGTCARPQGLDDLKCTVYT
jgi:hypothetical protein